MESLGNHCIVQFKSRIRIHLKPEMMLRIQATSSKSSSKCLIHPKKISTRDHVMCLDGKLIPILSPFFIRVSVIF
jgi:hypothetical protein